MHAKLKINFHPEKKRKHRQPHTPRWKSMMVSTSDACASTAFSRPARRYAPSARLLKQLKALYCTMSQNALAAGIAFRLARSRYRNMNGEAHIPAFRNAASAPIV
jgi:hypothetical protein